MLSTGKSEGRIFWIGTYSRHKGVVKRGSHKAEDSEHALKAAIRALSKGSVIRQNVLDRHLQQA